MDDTNVWRMKRGKNYDAEILSVMIRGSPHLKLGRRPIRSLLPSQLYFLSRKSHFLDS